MDKNELKDIVEQLHSDTNNNKRRIDEDYDKYLTYNGQIKEKIRKILYREFTQDKTVRELSNRIVPICITRKMVQKLSKVYNNGALRKPVTDSPADQELIDIYEIPFLLNQTMNYANQMTKLTKHCLLECYKDKNNLPRVRVVPSHNFYLFSKDMINPEKVTDIIKILFANEEKKNQRYAYWNNEQHFIFNGEGEIVLEEMQRIDNVEAENPYKTIPFVHITEQPDLLYPIRKSDISDVEVACSLLMSDACLAQKYLSWATLVLRGVGKTEEKIEVGPGAILNLPALMDGSQPSADYIQPQLNSDEVIRMVEKFIEITLTTNNLSAGTILGSLSTGGVASGVSKMLDNLDSTEDIREQREIYINAEKDLWFKFAHHILPVWVESKTIDPEYAGAFSPEFEISVNFPDMEMLPSKKERIETSRLELDAGLTSLARALKYINPDLGDDEIENLRQEIMKEKVETAQYFQRNMFNGKTQNETDKGEPVRESTETSKPEGI